MSWAQDPAKVQQQLKSLMSKEKQAELDKQEEQKKIVEQQRLLLAEKEKVVLGLQFEKKKQALQLEKNKALALIQKNLLESKFQEAIKDKKIAQQRASMTASNRYIIALIAVSVLIVLIAVFIFISQRKATKLNKLVISQHRELEQVGLVKDRLFSLVGHDLRSPFNVLISLSSLLKNGNISPEKMSVYMNQLQSTLELTNTLMNNLLMWSESQLQGYKAVILKQDISKIINEIVKLHQGRAIEKEITIINHVDHPVFAYCDTDMLAIVVRNLLSNAIKFTPVGGKIEILTFEENDALTLAVADTGIGLSDGNKIRFNKTIFHAHESTPGTAMEKGTGLGLLLCKTFTQLMNGHIFVDQNKNGQGSIFKIKLPNEKNILA